MNKTTIFAIIGGVGVVVALVAGILLAEFPKIIQKQVSKQLVISESSEDYDKFISPDVPIYLKFYLFHINNPDETLAGEKPDVTQKGPYSFLEKRVKVIDYFSDSGDDVAYKEVKTYHYDEATSRKTVSLSDVVTHINVPAMTVMGKSYHLDQVGAGEILRQLFPQAIKTQMFLNHTVGELLFDTYPIEFIDQLNSLLEQLSQTPVDLTSFAYFMDKNATDEGEFVVNTGKDNINNILSIESWNGSSKVNFWVNGSVCNDINGTDATGFAPNVKTSSKLEIFTTDVCRSFPLAYQEKSEVKGISTNRFVIPADAFYGPQTNPDNECFCIALDKNDCNLNGVLDISSCREYAPLVASSPHFFQADDDIYNAIIGLDERKADRYQTYLDIEPTTGKVLSAYKRLQISAWLRQDYSPVATNASVFLPLVWVEEGFEITDELASELKSRVIKKVKLGRGLIIAALVVGLSLVVVSLALYLYNKYRTVSINITN